MSKRYLVLTPSALREHEPDLVSAASAAVSSEAGARVAGAFSYVDRHGAKLAALRPELEPLRAWAIFAAEGELPSRSGYSVPVFTDYIVPVNRDELVETLRVGHINGIILFLSEAARKPVWALVLGDVNTELVRLPSAKVDAGDSTLPLRISDEDVAELKAAGERVAREDEAAAQAAAKAAAEGVE